jgi:hypothetical protein
MNLQDIITSCYARSIEISNILSEVNENSNNSQIITDYISDALKRANALTTCLVILLDDGITNNIPDEMENQICVSD